MATIWYISKYAAPARGGARGVRAFSLLREFTKLGHRSVMITSDSNHLIKVPALSGRSLKEEIEGVEIHWIRTKKYRLAQSISRVVSWIDFELKLLLFDKKPLRRPDAVIVSSLSLLTILNGLLLRWRYRCRLIFEIRDIWPLTLIEEGGFGRANIFVMLLGMVERLGYRRADAIVGTMPNLVEHVSDQCRDHAPVHCIPFGIPEETARSNDTPPPDWFDKNFPADRFVVCHSGTIGTTNALDTFLECARLLKCDPRIHFLLLGDGDRREDYEVRFSDLPNVTFAGAVPSSMVLSVLKRCDLLYFSVLPSKVWRYGMSLNKVIDYMLAAKPVVASYSGFPTFVEEAGAGSMQPAGDVVGLADEIVRYAELSTEQLAEIGQRGHQWLLQNRDYSILARDYLKVLFPADAEGSASQMNLEALEEV